MAGSLVRVKAGCSAEKVSHQTWQGKSDLGRYPSSTQLPMPLALSAVSVR